MKERLYWIDNAKFIGIYLVVLGHLQLSCPLATQVIYAFHVPLFFFVSGVLFAPNPDHNNHIKKCWYRLMVPYFIINTVFLVIHITANAYKLLLGEGLLYDIPSELFGVVFGYGYGTQNAKPVCAPTWFLPSLFLIWAFFGVASSKKRDLFLYSIMALLFTTIIGLMGIDKIPSPLAAIMCMPFFCGGMLIKDLLTSQKYWKNRKVLWLCVGVLLALVTIGLSSNNGRVECCRYNYGNNVLLFYLSAITGIGSICALSIAIGKVFSSFVENTSSGTILILGFHLFLISIFFDFSKSVFGLAYEPWMGVFVAFATLICFNPLIKIAHCYFPIILGQNKR